MCEFGDYLGELDEDTEMQNLPLYTEQRADGIYRYRWRVPKELVYRLGKGYTYHNLGRTKKDIVSKWSAADSKIEEILNVAKKNADKVAEISGQKDHRSLILLAREGGIRRGSGWHFRTHGQHCPQGFLNLFDSDWNSDHFGNCAGLFQPDSSFQRDFVKRLHGHFDVGKFNTAAIRLHSYLHVVVGNAFDGG